MSERHLFSIRRKADWSSDVFQNALWRASQAWHRIQQRFIVVLRSSMVVKNVIPVGREGGPSEEIARPGRNDLRFAPGCNLFHPKALLLPSLYKSSEAPVRGDGNGLRTSVLRELLNVHVQRIDDCARRSQVVVEPKCSEDHDPNPDTDEPRQNSPGRIGARIRKLRGFFRRPAGNCSDY